MFGLELVSTIANVGMFSLRASATAICSLLMSTINNAAGSLDKSDTEPKVFSNFSLSLEINKRSFLLIFSHVPSVAILSMVPIFLMALRIVAKLVNIPPGHLSVTYGMLMFLTVLATTSLACFFVATNMIFLPDLAICFKASQASSNLATVLLRSMI